jgi:N6-adenosine-specific RNA methylase IME4
MMARFSVILADPPWLFRTRSEKGKGRSAEQHYACLKIEDIKALPVESVSARDSALFLWATGPLLPEAIEVMRCWGFTYRCVAFTWVKRTPLGKFWHWGMGYWTRSNAEFCLLGARGDIRRVSAGVHSVLDDPVMNHSSKPHTAYDRIEALMGPEQDYLELFARNARPGWTAEGLELTGKDMRVALPALAALPERQAA